MFAEITLADIAKRYPKLSRADVDALAEWVAQKHATKPYDNPAAALESLARRKSEAAGARIPDDPTQPVTARAHAQPYFGWDASGSVIRSEIAVTNAHSDFARRLVTEIREQALTPADAVGIIQRQSEPVLLAFGYDALAAWVAHDHFDPEGRAIDASCSVSCWCSLPANRAITEWVRSWGGWYPWLRDPNAWAAILAHDATRRTPAA